MAHFADLVPLVDILYTNSPTHIKTWEEQTGGDNIRLMLPATDPELFYPVDVEKQIDLMYVGHCSDHRNEVIYKLSEEFEDLWVGGNWWDTERLNHYFGAAYKHDFSQWSSRSRIGLCLVPEAHRVEMYYPYRLVNTMATGTFALATYTPRLEAVFTRKKHLDWFSSYDELVELIHYYLEHDKEREEIAHQGYEYVINNLTFKQQARRVVTDLGLLS